MNKATDIVTDSSNVTSTSLPSFEGLREAVFAAVNSHNLSPTLTANSHSEVEVDSKKENIRASNRERKKKWRVHNEERNKDNDLRCRVNKRASKLYGEADSLEKETWAKEEFQRRRAKRMEKEQRKHIVNNVLSIPQSPVFDSMDTKLEFPPELQRQLLEQLNQSMLAITHGIKNYSTNNMEIESEDSIEKKPEYPMDAVLSLMQLNAVWKK